MPSLDLYLHDRYVGTVTPDMRNHARVRLDVDRDYQPEVLLSDSFVALPGRRPPASAVSNFLGGYMPEGHHRERMAAKRSINKDNLFALLSEFGGSVAGAVTLRHPSDEPSRPTYEPLTSQAIATKLRQALQDSNQGLAHDSRSTLPGYQPKVLVARLDGEWVYPHGRAHSTHLLKPQVPSRPSRIFDEYYSHLLTRQIGLSSFDSAIHRAGSITYLAIERFDRMLVGGQVRLLHQEDLAQALGLNWLDTDVKFQEPSWPDDPKRATNRRIGELLGSVPRGNAVLERWIRQLTYHLAIGNNDAHAKNTALLHLPSGTELSPVYDAVPNLFQQGLIKWDLALSIDGEFDHRRLSVERLLSEIKSWSVLPELAAEAAIQDTLTGLDQAITAITPPQGVSPGMVEQLRWNVDRLLAGNEIGQWNNPGS